MAGSAKPKLCLWCARCARRSLLRIEAGVVHRDFKSQNVMLAQLPLAGGQAQEAAPQETGDSKNETSRMRVVVTDFGLAQRHVLGEDSETSVTGVGKLVGTPAYMAPEQLGEGRELSAATDLYALGLVMYEMLTGELPFQGDTPEANLVRRVKEPAPSPRRLVPELSAGWEEAVLRCLEREPAKRFRTAHELLEALEGERPRQEARDSASEVLQALATEPEAAEVLAPSPTRPPSRAHASETPPSRLWTRRGSAATRRRWALRGLALAGLAVAVVLVIDRATERAKPIDSLAVLPFVNASGNPDADYLGDGLTEALINNLGQLPELKVIARSSVFRYKGQPLDPQKVRRELGVRAVLTGRILQRGEQLLISAELMDTDNDRHLWGKQYSRKLADLVVVAAGDGQAHHRGAATETHQRRSEPAGQTTHAEQRGLSALSAGPLFLEPKEPRWIQQGP